MRPFWSELRAELPAFGKMLGGYAAFNVVIALAFGVIMAAGVRDASAVDLDHVPRDACVTMVSGLLRNAEHPPAWLWTDETVLGRAGIAITLDAAPAARPPVPHAIAVPGAAGAAPPQGFCRFESNSIHLLHRS